MLQKIKSELFSCIQEIYPKIEFANNDIEVSCLYDEKGDFTSNLCLKYSKLLKEKPSDIAKNIIDIFKLNEITKIELAGPGFLNFFITDLAVMDLLNEEPSSFNDTSSVNIEFVSANPTGPLHLAHGREPLVQEIIKREKPDIICLQELKIDDHKYVSNFFLQFNYQTITQTQKSYNGVSISYNQNLDLLDLTISELNKTQARNNIILLKEQGIAIINNYFPNGNPIAVSYTHLTLPTILLV